MRYFVGLMVVLALSVTPLLACTDGGDGGTGGMGGMGGIGGVVAIDPLCEPQEQTCTDGVINEHTPCCEQVVPELVDACNGDESTENPASCAATEEVTLHKLTLMVTAPSCNDGFDLDACDGITCVPSGLAPFEGANGVDNALTGLAPTLGGIGGNLGKANQGFSDALCGKTDNPRAGVCDEDSANAGEACATGDDCTDGACNLYDDDCLRSIRPLVLTFAVDANLAESCANVDITSVGLCGTVPGRGSGDECTSDEDCVRAGESCLGGGTSSVIINLSDATGAGTVCASGTLGAIPMTIAGVPAVFGNVVVRATFDQTAGFSGLVGSTVDEVTVLILLDVLLGVSAAVAPRLWDISADLTQDTSAVCNAVSTALVVGGTAVREL